MNVCFRGQSGHDFDGHLCRLMTRSGQTVCKCVTFVFVFFFRFAERRFLFGQQFSDVLPVCRIDHGFEHFLKVLDIFSVNEAVQNLSFPGTDYYFAALR
ncbi:MAG: hypothetical protein WBZ16_21555 [Pseudolabrys sp.]